MYRIFLPLHAWQACARALKTRLATRCSLRAPMNSTTSTSTVRWVMHPSDCGTLVKLDEPCQEQLVPKEDQVITRPFLVDSVSKQPVPVRVVQLLEWHHSRVPTFVVVVRRNPES